MSAVCAGVLEANVFGIVGGSDVVPIVIDGIYGTGVNNGTLDT